MLKVRRAREAYFVYTFPWRNIMKKIMILVLALALALASAGCSMQYEKYTLFFASADGKSMAEESFSIEDTSSAEKIAYAVMEKLLEGPKRAEHKRAIPENTALLGIRLEEKTITVNLSQDFEKTVGPASRLMAIYSVVNTLCAIDGINKVQILVNGRKLSYTASEGEIGALSMNNVIVADEIGRNQTVVLELYFADEDKTALISEKRMLDIKDNETAEKTAIEELMKGPAAKGVKLLNEDIKVLSVETKDQYCYVNFSKEFLSLSAGISDLCVYSIVNTLARLPEVSYVLFLIEGEKAEKVGNTVLSEPFSYNSDIVN